MSELALAKRHIVLLEAKVRSTVAAGKLLHEGISKVAALSARLSAAVGDLSRVDLRADDPSSSIQAITDASSTVRTALTKARADVGKVSLLPEELAKELYCIALSEDKDIAKQLTDLDLNGTKLTLAELQVRLQNMQANANGRATPAVQALYGSARAAALLATSTPPDSAKPPDSRPWPRGYAARTPARACPPCPRYADDDDDTRSRKDRFPNACWWHCSDSHTWVDCTCLDSKGRPHIWAKSRRPF